MYTIKRTKLFERSYRKIVKGNAKLAFKKELEKVIDLLSKNHALPYRYKDHKLSGELGAYRECHVRPDLLLIYQKRQETLMLVLVDLGSHSQLFK